MSADPPADGRVIVQITRRLAATPDRLFDAFLDPEVARLFLFATPDGEMIRAEIDPRVGGRFTFVDRRPGMGDVEHVGTFVEIDRPHRLVFDFAVPAFSSESTRVTIIFSPRHPRSEISLKHEGVLADYALRTGEGWSQILAGLLPALEGAKAGGFDPGQLHPTQLRAGPG